MITCENCNKEHNGSYGSGRFCDEKCARTYSANINKDQKRKNTSKALKEMWKKKPHHWGPKARKAGTEKARKVFLKNLKILYETGSWEDLPFSMKQRRLLEEQQGKCKICEIKDWMGKPLKLHFDHIDGHKNNNSKENVRYICPNCHSQTSTYCGKKQKLPQFEHLKITKERLNGTIAQG